MVKFFTYFPLLFLSVAFASGSGIVSFMTYFKYASTGDDNNKYHCT